MSLGPGAARRLLDPADPPGATRDAATVVLLRDTPHGVEVYLLRRVTAMAFAGGMHVFPGGAVDPRDAGLPDTAWYGPDPAGWAGPLGAAQELARALVAAAVRETFEESGILLAGPPGGAVVPDTRGDDWEADRLALIGRDLSLAELLARRGLQLRADLLRPWAHWVTPVGEPRRFDTRFLVAEVPTGQQTRDVGGEADAVAWLAPAVALDRHAAGGLAMLPPTAVTLAEVAAVVATDPAAGTAGVLAAADRRTIRRILPRLVPGPDGDVVVLGPDDPGYDSTPGWDAGSAHEPASPGGPAVPDRSGPR